jgi:hypothetical protein
MKTRKTDLAAIPTAAATVFMLRGIVAIGPSVNSSGF